MALWGGTIELDRPLEEVWAFLTSEANDVNWRGPWVERVRALSEGPLRVGTRYETLYRFFGQSQRIIVEVTELDPPRRMAWRQIEDDRVARNDGSYDLEPLEGGRTRFTVTGWLQSRGWRQVADRPFTYYLNHGPVQRQHAQLAATIRALG